MRNYLLGYFFTRTLVGERAARIATLIGILGVGLFLSLAAGSMVHLFARSFLKGVANGNRKWEHVRQITNADRPSAAGAPCREISS